MNGYNQFWCAQRQQNRFVSVPPYTYCDAAESGVSPLPSPPRILPAPASSARPSPFPSPDSARPALSAGAVASLVGGRPTADPAAQASSSTTALSTGSTGRRYAPRPPLLSSGQTTGGPVRRPVRTPRWTATGPRTVAWAPRRTLVRLQPRLRRTAAQTGRRGAAAATVRCPSGCWLCSGDRPSCCSSQWTT
ncbi:translation initiation factor IF-2-like [Pollicipes pollicipes]|uniref:translation initiation factor IF-2-like n=1 Tax=Pollicipes pollicipes TaxID=41117 RepID=UPI0018849A4A|nr:translation initiation factor IF-2-like [Pollicipes pollicipes]